jgi:hypothetical protein
MGHRLLATLSALSLLLAIAVAVLWLTSYAAEPSYVFTRSDGRWEVAAQRGSLWLDNLPQRLDLSHQNAANVKRANERLPAMRAELNKLQAESSAAFDAAMSEMQSGRSDGPLTRRYEAAKAAEKQKLDELFTPPPNAAFPPFVGYSVHLAIPALAFMVLPIPYWRAQTRSRNRLMNGLCINCGYDLRASTMQCPECGTPIPCRGSEMAAK